MTERVFKESYSVLATSLKGTTFLTSTVMGPKKFITETALISFYNEEAFMF